MAHKSKSVRIEYAERMAALAEFMNIERMTLSDLNRGIDCIVTAYEQTAPELPALAGYAIKNLLENPPKVYEYAKALTALKKHMQKWKVM